MNNGELAKSLKYRPPFAIKEFELHWLNSGRSPERAIIKTLERSRKFKSKRNLFADSEYAYTKWDSNYFHVKCDCNDCFRDVAVFVFNEMIRIIF